MRSVYLGVALLMVGCSSSSGTGNDQTGSGGALTTAGAGGAASHSGGSSPTGGNSSGGTSTGGKAGANGSGGANASGGSSGAASSCPTPPVPATTWKLVFEDQFDGPALDGSLWRDWYTAGSYRNANGYNSYMDNAQALSFANGTMRVAGFQGPSGSPGCGGVVSTNNYGPGYYEARVKAGASWSAFWVQGVGADCSAITDGFEADVLETNRDWAPTSQHAMHWSGYGSCHQTASKNPLNLNTSDFHVIGMDWSAVRGVTMYVDGVESWSMPSATASNSGQIRFTIEGICEPTNPLEVDYFCYYTEQ